MVAYNFGLLFTGVFSVWLEDFFITFYNFLSHLLQHLKMFAKHFKNRNIQDMKGGKKKLSKVVLLPVPLANLDLLFLILATSSFMTMIVSALL